MPTGEKLEFPQVPLNEGISSLGISIFPSAEFAGLTFPFHCVITRISRSNPKVLTDAVPGAKNRPAAGGKPSQHAVRTRKI
jgi:hypothetical protein